MLLLSVQVVQEELVRLVELVEQQVAILLLQVAM
jgi:hypothetical protein